MRYALVAIFAGSLALACAPAPLLAADVLITEAEAGLPASPDAGLTLRGVTRGPSIEQVSPAPDTGIKSPLPIKIKFIARNNAAIEVDSVKITYLKSPSVDLTARLKSHLTADGIEVLQAQVPPGKHVLRVDIKDTQGRTTTSMIKLSVDK